MTGRLVTLDEFWTVPSRRADGGVRVTLEEFDPEPVPAGDDEETDE
jgi:hypothetical protein